MQPGAVFWAAMHAENHVAQKALSEKIFGQNVVTGTENSVALVHSKARPLICLQVFKSHCIAV